MADLAARQLGATVLSDLLDRKPQLLRPLAAQLLPPPLTDIDPAARLGIDLSSLRTVEDLRQVLATVLAAVARGDITPAEAAHIAERAEARLRARASPAALKAQIATTTQPRTLDLAATSVRSERSRTANYPSNLTGAAAICPPWFGITPGYCELPARSSSEDRGRFRFSVSHPGVHDAHGLSSDRIPAQDPVPDARGFAQARALDPCALGGNGTVPAAARGVARTREVRPSRRAALRQWRHSPRHRAQQGFEGRGQPGAADARQGRALCAGLGLPRPADRMDCRGAIPREKPIQGQRADRPVPPGMPRIRGPLDRGAEARLQAARRCRRLGQSLHDDGVFGRGADRPRARQVSRQWGALQGCKAGPVVGRRADRARRGGSRIPRPQIHDRMGTFSDPACRPAGARRRRGADLDDDAVDIAGQPRDRFQPKPRLRGVASRPGGRRKPRTPGRNLLLAEELVEASSRQTPASRHIRLSTAFPVRRLPGRPQRIRCAGKVTISMSRSWLPALSKPTRGPVSCISHRAMAPTISNSAR